MIDAKQSSLSKIGVGDTILTVSDGDRAFGFGRPKDPNATPCTVAAIDTERDQWSSKTYRVTLNDGRQSEGRYGTTHVYVTEEYDPDKAYADAEEYMRPATDDEVADADRCHQCKGYGVVRKTGAKAGKAYRTAQGAEDSTLKGNSEKCPTCKGATLLVRAA